MARKRYSDEMVRQVLRDVENGAAIGDVAKRYGIAEATYYRWRIRYGPAAAMRGKSLKELEEEHRRLRHLFTEAALETAKLRRQIEQMSVDKD